MKAIISRITNAPVHGLTVALMLGTLARVWGEPVTYRKRRWQHL